MLTHGMKVSEIDNSQGNCEATAVTISVMRGLHYYLAKKVTFLLDCRLLKFLEFKKQLLLHTVIRDKVLQQKQINIFIQFLFKINRNSTQSIICLRKKKIYLMKNCTMT